MLAKNIPNFVLQSKALRHKVRPMSIRNEAEENLRIIRSLMEKATVYRAISAPGALAGGLGATAIAIYGGAVAQGRFGSPATVPQFLGMWIGLLVVVTVANFMLLARDAARRSEPFVSPGMKLALRAMLPGLLAGGMLGLAFSFTAPQISAAIWVLLYGVSLLAAAHFAPKSICWLGRAFFLAGTGLFALFAFGASWESSPLLTAHAAMGLTFGLFHIVYAALTWPRRRPGADN